MKENDLSVTGRVHSNGGNFISFEQPLRLNFNPKEDITAYELAIILPAILSGRGFYQAEYDGLRDDVKRHLEIIK